MKAIEAVAIFVAWLAAKGLDRILGRWLAFFVIAFETRASDKAKAAFSAAIDEVKKNAPEKAQAWDNWRRKHAAP